MSDDRVETHVVLAEPGQRTVHFQEWWVRLRAAVPAAEIIASGAAEARPAPGVLDAIEAADFVLLPPSNPVVSIGVDPRGARDRRGGQRQDRGRRLADHRRCARYGAWLTPA